MNNITSVSFKLLLLSLTLWLCSCKAQPLDERIDNLIRTAHEDGRFNGVALIARQGEIIYHQGFGIADIETNAPITLDRPFRLASVSKQFTAMAVMLLKAEGRLDYDVDIRIYLPEFPYEEITVRHLLHHTSGLPDYIMLFEQVWDIGKDEADKKIAYNRDMLEILIKHRPPVEFAPGERWSYSNTGYVTLALIVERIANQSIGSFLKTWIFDPLDMVHSRAFDPNSDFAYRVYGYRVEGDRRISIDRHFLNGMVGDGGLYSTAQDLFKWDQALYTDQLIDQATLAEALTSGVLNNGELTDYGFGWNISETKRGSKRVGHGGGWVGFKTYIDRDLEKRDTIILLTNHSSAHFSDMLESVRDILNKSR